LANNVRYQSFWTLSANPKILQHEILQSIAKNKRKTAPQVLFCYLTSLGIAPLTGTTSEKHMNEDLDIFNFQLSSDECSKINTLGPFTKRT